MAVLRAALVVVLLLAAPFSARAVTPRLAFVASSDRRRERELVSTNMLLNPMVANLVAGSVAGAIGCGLGAS